WVFKNSLPKRSTSVLLFSDFETSSSTADKIVKLIKDNQKKHDNQKETHDLRIFSMVMSNIVSNHLAESIARVGKRYTQYVSDLEQINRKALAMLKNSLNPPTLDYEITCTLESNEESQNNDLKVKQVPLEIPELYIGPLIVQDPLYGSKFHPLAARKLIQEIEDGNYYLTMQMIKSLFVKKLWIWQNLITLVPNILASLQLKRQLKGFKAFMVIEELVS
ncbi:9706_t:CDS:2, partial [Ambispora leptoticha]